MADLKAILGSTGRGGEVGPGREDSQKGGCQ